MQFLHNSGVNVSACLASPSVSSRTEQQYSLLVLGKYLNVRQVSDMTTYVLKGNSVAMCPSDSEDQRMTDKFRL